MILFKKSKLVLDAFTCRPDIFEYSKLRNAKDTIPQWWKDLPKTIDYKELFFPIPTMKTCYGFIQQFRHGFFVPMWSDLALEIDSKGSTKDQFQFSDRMSRAQSHPQNERGSFLPLDDWYHLKLINPWVFQCKEDIMWQSISALWNMDNPSEYLVPSGIFDFKGQAAANINLFFKRQENPYRVLLPHGQPMTQIIPLTDKTLELKQHLITEQEYAKIRGKHAKISFISKYLKGKASKMKCPFSNN